MSSQNLCEITFYVENQRIRPGTVNPQPMHLNIVSRRRFTPIVRSRDIRKKFFSNHETIEAPQIMTDRRPIQKNVIKSCELKKGYRRSVQLNDQELRHAMFFQKQRQNYARVVKKYSVRADSLKRDMDKFLDFYA